MTRWIRMIQEYNITIKYIKPADNKIVDTLSRCVLEYVEPYEADNSDLKILAIKPKITGSRTAVGEYRDSR